MIWHGGTKVRNVTTGETGTVLGRMSWGGVRVRVDVDPDDWKDSVIGPPSNVTAVWEGWNLTTNLDPGDDG